MRVARRVLGESHNLTLRMRKIYAHSLYKDTGATLGELREAVTRHEELEVTARRVLGAGHHFTIALEQPLRESRFLLHARETLGGGA